MKVIRPLKIISILLALVVGLVGFYKFMTYDRNYTFSKEYKEELKIVAEKSGFIVGKTEEIDVSEIKRSTEKTIKIKIQKFLSKANLMNYGYEFGESTKLTTEKNDIIFNCKGWCLSDHLIGLEIEYNIVDDTTFETFKGNIEKKFENYKIVWTQLNLSPHKNHL